MKEGYLSKVGMQDDEVCENWSIAPHTLILPPFLARNGSSWTAGKSLHTSSVSSSTCLMRCSSHLPTSWICRKLTCLCMYVVFPYVQKARHEAQTWGVVVYITPHAAGAELRNHALTLEPV